MEWTDELKKQVVDAYKAMNPTPENSAELVKEIAEQFEASPNGVRMILVKEGAYVKKDPATAKATAKSGEAKEGGAKRVSKEDQISALTAAIESAGGKVDSEILGKLTGKAAAYFVTVIEAVKA